MARVYPGPDFPSPSPGVIYALAGLGKVFYIPIKRSNTMKILQDKVQVNAHDQHPL